jgi:transposase
VYQGDLELISHVPVSVAGTWLISSKQRPVRRGKKRAIVAVAHSMLVSVWPMLTYQQPSQELGGDYFDARRKESKVNYPRKKPEAFD